MTPVNKLVRGDDTVHLDYGFDGFWLQPDGYNPAIAEENLDGTWPNEVNEVVNMRIVGSSANDIARSQKALKLMLWRAQQFVLDQTDQTSTWWHQRLACEDYERRAFVRHARTENRSPIYTSPMNPGGVIRDYSLGIARAPAWEALVTSELTKSAALEAGGDMWNYGAAATVAGDMPARIASMRFYASTGIFTNAWGGIRSDLLGDRTAFEPVWQCGDGTATPFADTTCAPGGAATCTFAGTQTMTERFTITLQQAVGAGNEDEQRGRHLVLLRAAVTGTAVARLRLKSGFKAPADTWLTHNPETINDTTYYFYAMGSIQVPPKSLHATQDIAHWEDESTFGVAIEAELVSGAGNLVMERFTIIPQGEGWFAFKNSVFTADNIASASFLLTTPGDKFIIRPYNSQLIETAPRLEVDRTRGFYLPPGEASIVCAAEDATGQNLAHRFKIGAVYYPRWSEFRGDDV